MSNSFGTKTSVKMGGAKYEIFHLGKMARSHPAIERLPFSLKILLENLLRFEDSRVVRAEDIEALIGWNARSPEEKEISFHPARVLLQDFTGVPAVVDLAAMREAMAALGGNPERINPLQNVDLVIDHSVQVDEFGTSTALRKNAELEFDRNQERYAFLRWGQQAFRNFRVVPPDTGICHQINLEYLAQVVFRDDKGQAYPDTLVGTDSHTTMINGLGVLGWGVGGIEAEAAMLGQPLTMLIPQVVGVRLRGEMLPGTTATDLVLAVTQMLRKHGVVGKFVEFFGPGLAQLSLADRATLANMAPEYGATMGFFPVDEETLSYLRFTNRPKDLVSLVEAYSKEQGLFHTPHSVEPTFSSTIDLDLGTVVPSIAGPKRPQDRIALTDAKPQFKRDLLAMLESTPVKAGSVAQKAGDRAGRRVTVKNADFSYELGHGSVAIAAITSCTNTSNPTVLLTAGLLARNAVQRGLSTMPWVKTSLAPGSMVVTDYLQRAGVLAYLEGLGFHTVGYGCTTCIGNSGALPEPVAAAAQSAELLLAAVLSGNRNFEGRINSLTRMNYLASPPLVVAYALAGHMNIDFDADPVGHDRNGSPVYLRDIWPSPDEVQAAVEDAVQPEQFARRYGSVFDGDARWQGLKIPLGQQFVWQTDSTYIRQPTFFAGMSKEPGNVADIRAARVLAILGDSVTTDHISPAGSIARDSPAARYLLEHGVAPADFNSYGSRRGNHEVMMRGTFANIRLRNRLVDVEGGLTVHLPTGEQMSIYDAAMKYQAEHVPLVILAGKEYGTGSSRDWAAKGTRLLGVAAVIAKSFERIHRSNLVGMGVLPLEFAPDQDVEALHLTGKERLEITGIAAGLAPHKKLEVTAKADDGRTVAFSVVARLDTPNEVEYYKHGGILLYVLRTLARS